eukprot:3854214-Pyramimonas_sp.AAC.1
MRGTVCAPIHARVPSRPRFRDRWRPWAQELGAEGVRRAVGGGQIGPRVSGGEGLLAGGARSQRCH